VVILVNYVGMTYGPIGAFLAEFFPSRIRYTSVSVPYHIGNGWGGGLVPIVTTAAYAKAVTLLGPSGAGQLTKMVNQIAIAGLLQGLSEAIAFGERAGLDLKTVLGVIGKGAAQSWQMDNRGPTMIERRFDFGFAVDLMRKDLGLVLDEARRNGAQLPVTALVDQFYAELQADGGNRADTSSLIRRLKATQPPD